VCLTKDALHHGAVDATRNDCRISHVLMQSFLQPCIKLSHTEELPILNGASSRRPTFRWAFAKTEAIEASVHPQGQRGSRLRGDAEAKSSASVNVSLSYSLSLSFVPVMIVASMPTVLARIERSISASSFVM